MRLPVGRIPAALAGLGRVSVVALHGEDESQVRDAARSLIRAELGGQDDPFRVTTLVTCEGPALEEHLRARPLGGRRGVVWVAEASERLAPIVERRLGTPDAALLLLGYGSRFARSSLARVVGDAPDGWLVDCAPDLAAGRKALEASLRSLAVTATVDAAEALVAWADATGQLLAGVGLAAALLVGRGGVVDAAVVGQLAGSEDATALGCALAAGMAGNPTLLDRTVGNALADGQGGIGLIRQALAQIRFSRGGGGATVERNAGALWAAERTAKRTGMPGDLVGAAAVRALGMRHP